LDAALARAKAPSGPFIIGDGNLQAPPLPLFELTREAIEAATIEERDAIIRDLKNWNLLRLPFPRIAIRFPQEPVAQVLGWAFFKEAAQVTLTMCITDTKPLDIERLITTPRVALQPDEKNWWDTNEEAEAAVARGHAYVRHVVKAEVMATMHVRNTRSGYLTSWMDINKLNTEHEGAGADYRALALEALTILLASLAAKNVIKDERYNGRTSKAEGDRPVYVSDGVTYISRTIVRPPAAEHMESDPDHPPREQSKPHLRRGHQHTVIADTTVSQPEGVRVTIVGKGRAGRRVQWFAPTYVNVDKGYIIAPHYKVRP